MLHVHLYSAGVDSFIGSLYLLTELDYQNYYPIYFNLGHRYSRDEMLLIRKYLPQTQIVENVLHLTQIEDETAHIPFRNVLLITTVASLYAYSNEPVTIYINSMADDRVSDQGSKFIEQMNELLNSHKVDYTTYEVKSSMPLEWTKFDAVDWYLENSFNPEWLKRKTFSCYSPTAPLQHCYSCNACFRRNTLLHYAGISLPFYNKQLVESYYDKAIRKVYPEKRNKAILNYIDWLRSNGYV